MGKIGQKFQKAFEANANAVEHFTKSFNENTFKVMTEVYHCDAECAGKVVGTIEADPDFFTQTAAECHCQIPFELTFPPSYLARIDVPLLFAMDTNLYLK